MDNTGEYATIKLVNEQEEHELKFGEFKLDRENSTIYVGRNGFPIEKEGGTNEQNGN